MSYVETRLAEIQSRPSVDKPTRAKRNPSERARPTPFVHVTGLPSTPLNQRLTDLGVTERMLVGIGIKARTAREIMSGTHYGRWADLERICALVNLSPTELLPEIQPQEETKKGASGFDSEHLVRVIRYADGTSRLKVNLVADNARIAKILKAITS